MLVNDPEINAFVAQGQVVYIHSGLLTASDNANQLQGVIAHELGHVAGGHAIRIYEGARQATAITILSLVLGAAAMAAGAGDAGMGIMAAGQQAAMGSFLAFTRAQEASSDQAGAAYLSKAGISGRGSIEFFKKLQNQEYRLAIYAKDSYDRTHPLSNERIAALTEIYQKDPAWNRKTDPALEARFQRVKAKLVGYVTPEGCGQILSGEQPERSGALCPGLCLSPRRLPGQGQCRGRRPARHRPRRSLLPRAEGPDPARVRPAEGSHRRRCARRSPRRPTCR